MCLRYSCEICAVYNATNYCGQSVVDLKRMGWLCAWQIIVQTAYSSTLVSRVSPCSRGLSFVMYSFALLLLRPLAYKCVLGN